MAIRERLYPDQESAVIMVRHCADARYVWNIGLEQRNLWVRHRSARVNYHSQQKELAEARRETWLGQGSSSIQQTALRDLNQAFQNWWENPQHFSRPTWRKSGLHQGFYVRDLTIKRINRHWGEVFVPKCGRVPFKISRQWSDIEATTSARVTLDRAGRWHVSFTAPQPAVARTKTGVVIGLDMGIAQSVTTSDGNHLSMPKLLSSGEVQRKRRLQRQMARQQKGSHRRVRTKHAVAVLAAREADRRKDWIEKTTTDMVREFDVIVIENLKVKNMVRSARGTIEKPGKSVAAKSGLNRSIHSQAWGTFRQRLTDKAGAATSPVEIIVINPAYTSQRCSGCGHTTAKNRKSQAVFVCQSCTYTDNADVNAAKNILAAGLAVTGRGGTLHAPPTLSTDQAQQPDEASRTEQEKAA